MKIFTLDPSLTATGWCVAEVTGHEIEVLHVGRIVVPKDGSTVDRTRQIIDGVRDVAFKQSLPSAPYAEIVIEIPSGRVANRHTGGGFGLAKYGFVVGSIHQMLEILMGRDQVHAIDEGTWTGSRSKQVRKKIAVQHCNALKRIKDPGMDISDAVALAVWWAQVGRHKKAGGE